MSTSDLETELALERGRKVESARPNSVSISIEEALAFRDAGNVPDEHGRTLRLVLRASRPGNPDELQSKRLTFEPDYLNAPSWRRPGSVPVNVVPLLASETGNGAADASATIPTDRPWWDHPDLARLEDEWAATGAVDGIAIPAAYRGFVYKTVVELRSAGRAVTVDTITNSIARWTRADDVAEIRRALEAANPGA
jgi:hypothetical protein